MVIKLERFNNTTLILYWEKIFHSYLYCYYHYLTILLVVGPYSNNN